MIKETIFIIAFCFPSLDIPKDGNSMKCLLRMVGNIQGQLVDIESKWDKNVQFPNFTGKPQLPFPLETITEFHDLNELLESNAETIKEFVSYSFCNLPT